MLTALLDSINVFLLKFNKSTKSFKLKTANTISMNTNKYKVVFNYNFNAIISYAHAYAYISNIPKYVRIAVLDIADSDPFLTVHT